MDRASFFSPQAGRLIDAPLAAKARFAIGDVVAGANGLLVAGRSADRRGAELNFSPASERVRSKYERLPVMARE